MKFLLFILLVCTVSCRPHYRHEFTYSVEITYDNGQKDTLNGKLVQPDSESSKCMLYLELGKSSCLTVKNGLLNYQRLACGVRNFKIFEEKINTVKGK